MFLLTKYQYYIYIFSPFPPLTLVPRFPFSPFQSSPRSI